jgi:dTDP-4-amino-4,6-dideoxygalactose transaminase
MAARDDFLPVIRPTLPPLAEVEALLRSAWASGTVTLGTTVRAFEDEVRARTGARHAVAVSSCTAGLMLVPQALGLPRGGEVIVPSFTFAATAQALVWNGLVPVFCDSVPGTCTLDPEDAERNLSPRTVAICAVYTYGLPPDIDALLDLGRRKGLPVYFDSAQGLGATYRQRDAGRFGRCEVFSLSPTKVVTAIEGGLVTTDDDTLAERLRSMRDYGRDPRRGEEMVYLGLSARMDEMHAAVGLLSLRRIGALVASRHRLIARYRARLAALPGCRVQEYPADRTTSGNYFVLFVGDGARGSRDALYEALHANGIQTKRYFHPPVHEHAVFRGAAMRVSDRLEASVRASRQALALPLYSHMADDQVDRVCEQAEKVLA